MKKKRLILHVGYSKCGSTTIQETLSDNYSKLLKENILYPRVLSESPAWLRFFWEPNLPVTYPEERVKGKFNDFSARLKKEIRDSPANTVILSDEGLISLPSEGVLALKNFLVNFFEGYEINVVCIVREPVSFFTSRCQQFISERCFDETAIRKFIEGGRIENGEVRSDCHAMNPIYVFSNNIKKYKKIFGSIVVIDFESAASAPEGFTAFILKSVGIESDINDIRFNESRSDKAIDVISYINSKMPFNVALGHWKSRKYGDLKIFYSLKGGKYELPYDLKLMVRKKVESEVDWLHEKYGIDYRTSSLQEVPSKIIWDEVFYQQAISLFPALPLHLKIFFKSYVVDKVERGFGSKMVGLLKTKAWIKNKYPLVYVCNNDFGFLLIKVSRTIQEVANKMKIVLRPVIVSRKKYLSSKGDGGAL